MSESAKRRVCVVSITSVPMGFGKRPLWRASVDGCLLVPEYGKFFKTKKEAQEAATAWLNHERGL